MRKPNRQDKPLNDLSRSLTPLDVNQTLIAVIELSKESWLVAGIIPGVERQPLKKLLADEDQLLSCSSDGERKPRRRGTRSTAFPLPLRPAATAFGWLAG